MIYLPPKSTHILQPLAEDLLAIPVNGFKWIYLAVLGNLDFLELLFPARDKEYTVAIIIAAFGASGC